MDRQQIRLKLTLEELGVPFSVETFDDRLVLQKAVYLAQAANVHLGYHYRWYLRGPYSSALASDAFAIAAEAENGDDESSNWRLDQPTRTLVEDVAALVASGDRAPQARDLELLASVHFLVRHRKLSPEDSAEVMNVLHAFGKKDFTQDEIDGALQRLTAHSLLS